MKIRKNGKTVNLTETEIKQIVNKHKINKFLSEQAITRSMRDEIHDLMKAYERIINSKVSGIDILADSKVEDLMSKVKRAMLQNVEDLRKEVRSSEDKKRSEIEKRKNK
jgi:methyl coenzyme M reductase alpha subunit